jgi:hypothetical protein
VPDSPEEIRHPDGRIEHPNVHREETDASFGPILMLLIGAGGVALVIYLLITAFYYGRRDHETAAKKTSFPLAPALSTDPNVLAPLPAGEPRLEQEDRLAGVVTDNVYDTLAAKESILHSFGSNKDEKDFVHIPIEQAMKLVENKLPVRAKPSADQAWRADGLIDSGESNSGHEFRGKPR